MLVLVLSMFRPFLLAAFESTDDFQQGFADFQYVLGVTRLDHPSLSEVKKLPIEATDIRAYRYENGDRITQLSRIRQAYQKRIKKAEANKETETVAMLKKERDRKTDRIERIFKSDKYVIGLIRKQRVDKISALYQAINNSEESDLQEMGAVYKYRLTDRKTGRVVTNIPRATDEQKVDKRFAKTYRAYPGNQYTDSPFAQNDDNVINRVFQLASHDYKGEIYIPKGASMEKVGADADYRGFATTKTTGYVLLAFGLALTAVGFYCIRRYAVFRLAGLDGIRTRYRRLPLEGRLAILLFELLFFFTVLEHTNFYGFSTEIHFPIFVPLIGQIGNLVLFYTGIVIAITTLLYQLQWLAGTLHDPAKRKKDLSHSLAAQAKRMLHELLVAPFIGVRALILAALFFLIGIVFTLGLRYEDVTLIWVFLFCTAVPLLWMTLKRAVLLNRIFNSARDADDGNEGADLPEEGGGVMSRFAHLLNRLRRGIRASRSQQLKSERLKTELITNVSHDLRTPLTSILTYNDLLRKPHISEAERQDYLAVIDRKAKQLKRLIDDLFAVSKMASGAVQLHKTVLDLNELLTQALAEYDEAITRSKLDFHVRLLDQPLNVAADGRKLWRVFSNLIGNILKYSFAGTRVYIILEKHDHEAVATFKNITKYELGDNVDELFERFKRGDASRHTEGSGLGLAIAKSIVDLHDGRFIIAVDGDLFKVTVRLPVGSV
jgi:signal transduction histidine kinase